MKKIHFPSAGLLARNLRDSGDGAHAVLRWNLPAAFSHPWNPKISKIAIGPDCFGETDFLPRQNPFPGRGIRAVRAKPQCFAVGPHERGGLKASFILSQVTVRRANRTVPGEQAADRCLTNRRRAFPGGEGILSQSHFVARYEKI